MKNFEMLLPSRQTVSGIANSENEFRAKFQNKMRQYGVDDESALAMIASANPGQVSYFNTQPAGIFESCLNSGLSAIANAGQNIEI